MRRRLLVLLLACLGLVGSGSHAAATPEAGVVLHPTLPGGAHPALLVLLPASGRTAAEHLAAGRAAQATAEGVRLWVAVADAGVPAADALVRYELLIAQVRAAGFDVRDDQVVVAAWGDAVLGLRALMAEHKVAAVATLGSAEGTGSGDLRILAELDRSAQVVRAALRPGPLLVLPGVASPGLRAEPAGAVLGDVAQAAVADPTDLMARRAADRIVAAVSAARTSEGGPVCADLQATTADLAAADVHRLTVQNRFDADLMAPTPEGAAQRDLGGFLYDKAELVDDGDTARVVTNSHTPAGEPALEVMCKTKSRSAVAQAIYGTHLQVDATPPSCADFTRGTLAWVRAQLSATAVARSGGVTVLPDLAKSAGPEWVFSPLVLRPADPVGGRWEVQSPALVTQLSDTDLDPTFAGNHYCKVLSPLRALELVLEDTAPAAG